MGQRGDDNGGDLEVRAALGDDLLLTQGGYTLGFREIYYKPVRLNGFPLRVPKMFIGGLVLYVSVSVVLLHRTR